MIYFDHVSVVVSDLAAAERFYGELLQLPLIARPPLHFAGLWFGLGGEQALHLLAVAGVDPVHHRPTAIGRDRHLALRVDALAPYQQRLTAAGVAVTPSSSGRAALFCRDPDGNGIELILAAPGAESDRPPPP